jgi:diaminohydroxyphosphoribosylaminopyrimidine deaminase/5-amino-6-(5-phosphoribosylamino)uracil reductase
MTAPDEIFMRECFRLALRGAGRVSPNPLVGAVLVKGGTIVSRGYHHVFGGPHAEVNCLNAFNGDPTGTTLFVNLEPCAHTGKTPPCVDLILSKKIGTVVIATRDPNPLVSGRGIQSLRRAGVNVRVGILESEARWLNRAFFTSIMLARPHVHLKIAKSRDGLIASPGKSRWISSPASRRLVHRWRAALDAVLVGAGTIRADNPRLDVRHVDGRDPAVVILDGRLRTPPGAHVLSHGRRVVLFTTERSMKEGSRKVAVLRSKGVEVVPIASRSPMLPLDRVLVELYKRNIGSVLVEGGRTVFSRFLSSGLVDELSVFVAPKYLRTGVPVVDEELMGRSTGREFVPESVRVIRVGKDLLIHAVATIPA